MVGHGVLWVCMQEWVWMVHMVILFLIFWVPTTNFHIAGSICTHISGESEYLLPYALSTICCGNSPSDFSKVRPQGSFHLHFSDDWGVLVLNTLNKFLLLLLLLFLLLLLILLFYFEVLHIKHTCQLKKMSPKIKLDIWEDDRKTELLEPTSSESHPTSELCIKMHQLWLVPQTPRI